MTKLEHLSSVSGKFELLVQSVTDYAICTLDPQGRVSSWNPGARHFNGFELDEIIGHDFSRFYTPEKREQGIPRIGLQTAEREGRFEAKGWRVRKHASITLDLTERRAAEQEHRAVSSWNAGAERSKGYRTDEVIGQHFSRFYTDEERDAGVPALLLE
jgi:PAS domain S-box-containing protein